MPLVAKCQFHARHNITTIQQCLHSTPVSPSLQAAPSGRLALPFVRYRFVTAHGRPLDRVRRHPFGLSRALYGTEELTPRLAGDAAVWAEPRGCGDFGGGSGGGSGGGPGYRGGFRWRQSAGEVHIIATLVRQIKARADAIMVLMLLTGAGPATSDTQQCFRTTSSPLANLDYLSPALRCRQACCHVSSWWRCTWRTAA